MLALIRNRWIIYIQSPKSTFSRYETLMLRSSPKRFGYVDTPWSYIRSYALGYSVRSLRTGLGSLRAVRRALEALQRRLRPTAAATSQNRDERDDFPVSAFLREKSSWLEGGSEIFELLLLYRTRGRSNPWAMVRVFSVEPTTPWRALPNRHGFGQRLASYLDCLVTLQGDIAL